MSTPAFVPAATLVRRQPGTPLAATPAGSVVHVLNRPGGAPICRRDPATVDQLPTEQPAPPLRVCAFCIRAMPAKVRLNLQSTDEERTAVHTYADRQRPEPLFLAVPEPEEDS